MIFEKLSQARDEVRLARLLLILAVCYTSWLVSIWSVRVRLCSVILVGANIVIPVNLKICVYFKRENSFHFISWPLLSKICSTFYIPQSICQYRTKNEHNIPHTSVKHQLFKRSYFPSIIIEWSKIGSNIRNSETLNIFLIKNLKIHETHSK